MENKFDYGFFGDRLKTVESDLSLNRPYISGYPLPVKHCWHISTEGKCVDYIFDDTRDFVSGMNRVAMCAIRFQVVVLAFCLMNNHVHFVLYGSQEECEKFIYEFLRITSMDIAKQHREHKKLSNVPVNIRSIEDLDYLQNVICYDIQNPSTGKTGYGYHDYPWSSGPLYFRKEGLWASPEFIKLLDDDDNPRVRRIGDIGIMESRELISSRSSFPADWKLLDGFIFPGYYIPVDIVEKIFRTQRGYKHVFRRLKEDEIDADNSVQGKIRLNDKEMRGHRDEISKALFGHANIRSLNADQRMKLAKYLKNKFNSSPRQIAAMACIPFKEVESLWLPK